MRDKNKQGDLYGLQDKIKRIRDLIACCNQYKRLLPSRVNGRPTEPQADSAPISAACCLRSSCYPSV
jgi:hypothetical protein